MLIANTNDQSELEIFTKSGKNALWQILHVYDVFRLREGQPVNQLEMMHVSDKNKEENPNCGTATRGSSTTAAASTGVQFA